MEVYRQILHTLRYFDELRDQEIYFIETLEKVLNFIQEKFNLKIGLEVEDYFGRKVIINLANEISYKKDINISPYFKGYIAYLGEENNNNAKILVDELAIHFDTYIKNSIIKETDRKVKEYLSSLDSYLDNFLYNINEFERVLFDKILKDFDLYSWKYYKSNTVISYSNLLEDDKSNFLKTIELNIEDTEKVIFYYKSIKKELEPILKNVLNYIKRNLLKKRKYEIIARRFNKYVNSNVLKSLYEDPSLLNPKKDDVVIMSVDLVNSTQFASNVSPLQTFSTLNFYLSTIAKIILEEYEGTLDKFIGDEVMAIFGAPIKTQDFLQRSVECAISIRTKLLNINKSRENALSIKITLGYAKDVIIGEVGTKETQLDYTVIGDSVNRFFRIAKYGIENQIIVNKEMYKKLKDLYDFKLLGKYSLKGVSEPEEIYQLII